MLEEEREEAGGELGRVPYDEAGVGGAPGNDVVGGGVVDHVVGLDEEGGRAAAGGAGGSGGGGGFHEMDGWMDGRTEDFGDVGDERNLFLVEFGGIGRRTPPLTAVAFLDFFFFFVC